MNCKYTILSLLLALLWVSSFAQDNVDFSATAIGSGASGNFAPYMIGSWNHGKTPMNGAALIDAEAHKNLDMNKRFSWAAGAEFLSGYSASANYQRFDSTTKTWSTNSQSPSAIWLQQLYASVKWRSLFLTAGLKDRGSRFVDNDLSSGDLIHSNNARSVPQVRAGFIDFQDIPLTNHWVQIEGEVAYGKMADNNYLENHYNYYNSHLTTGILYTYKRIAFRTKPSEPLSVIAAMQATGFFGGDGSWYYNGVWQRSEKYASNLKAAWKMFIPMLNNGDGYYEGSQVGSFDFKAQYRINNSHKIAAYFQWLWEDGSGMARRNKTDGLWGIEYHRTDNNHHALQGVVAEYIDFRDQSGPLHWAPGDHPGTTMTNEATGGDDYYNNTSYNSYSYFGMSMGSPFVLSPIYNLNGYPQFIYTRSNGVHIAANGWLSNSVNWRAAASYAKAWGSGRRPQNTSRENTSMLVEAGWNANCLLNGLSIKGAIAFDAGKLRGNNFGALVSVTYKGNISLKK
jgi:hypothetical protein